MKTKTPPRRFGITRIALALALGVLLGRSVCAPADAGHDPLPATDSATASVSVWTCAMHPQVKLPQPGQCPICFMDLIPLQDDGDDGLHPSQLRVSENAAALAGLVTAPVERRQVARQVRLVGKVAIDETAMAYITAWVPSRLDRLYVDYTGVTVRKGDHLVEVYSPMLLATQQELLGAVRSAELLGPGSLDLVRDRQAQSVASARDRLRLWGLSNEQIDAVIERGEPSEHLTINAPVGGVVIHKNAVQGDYVETGTRIYTIADLTRAWVVLDAYERDLPWLHYGQQVKFHSESWPGETFEGRISFIDPVLNDRTRTVKVRVNVDNTDMRLKPDMFVRASVEAPMTAAGRLLDPELLDLFMCPMHPEAVAPEPGPCPRCGMDLAPTAELGFSAVTPAELPLVIPATAPLVTGTRAVVYVRLPGDGPPVFEGRQVVLGPRAGDDWVVREGLSEGEQVVVHGAFKLDSELQIRARPSMMSAPGDDELHAGHASQSEQPRVVGTLAATPGFQLGLGTVVDALIALSTSLAADDSAATRSGATALGAALLAVPMDGLDAAAHQAWMPMLATLRDAAERAASADDIADQRAAVGQASVGLIHAFEVFGWHGEQAAPGVFFCPMAFGGDGGHWLSRGDAVANPYYGAAMLRCGDRLSTLGQSAGER